MTIVHELRRIQIAHVGSAAEVGARGGRDGRQARRLRRQRHSRQEELDAPNPHVYMEFIARGDRGDAKHARRRRVEKDALRACDAVVHWPPDVLTANGHLHVIGLVPIGSLVGTVLEEHALDGDAANIAVPSRLPAVAEPKHPRSWPLDATDE